MQTTLLLDADIEAYQTAAGVQKNYQWDEETLSIDITKTDEEILTTVDDHIKALADLLKADRVIVCLSDPEVNFRKAILPSYKGHRTGAKPVKLMWLKDMLALKYETFMRPTLEADDVMGILSTHHSLIPGKKIIVSIDKDMKTIPGWLFNPDKDKAPREVSLEEADYFHMYQTVCGDATDNYKGCPNAGPAAANAVLLDGDRYLPVPEMWERVVEVYEAAKEKKTKKPLGLTEEDALVQARCARILRSTDYNFKKKEPILWQPPK